MGNAIKKCILHTLKFCLHTLSCHFWLNLCVGVNSFWSSDAIDLGQHWLKCSVEFTWEQFHKKCSWTAYPHHRCSKIALFSLPWLVPDAHEFNVLWSGDAIRQRSGSTWAQVMTCCLMAPSHYLNQCWLLISGALWCSLDSNFKASAQVIIL